MMLANAPVVWLGDKLVKKVPIRLVHVISAVIFLVLGWWLCSPRACRVWHNGPHAPICFCLRALYKYC